MPHESLGRFARFAALVAATNARGDATIAMTVASGGAIYLNTGRATSEAVPEESYTGPSVLEPPGRYLAEPLLDGRVAYVVVWRDRTLDLRRQRDRVEAVCPGTFTSVPPLIGMSTEQPMRFLRVRRDDACLRGVVTAPDPTR